MFLNQFIYSVLNQFVWKLLVGLGSLPILPAHKNTTQLCCFSNIKPQISASPASYAPGPHLGDSRPRAGSDLQAPGHKLATQLFCSSGQVLTQGNVPKHSWDLHFLKSNVCGFCFALPRYLSTNWKPFIFRVALPSQCTVSLGPTQPSLPSREWCNHYCGRTVPEIRDPQAYTSCLGWIRRDTDSGRPWQTSLSFYTFSAWPFWGLPISSWLLAILSSHTTWNTSSDSWVGITQPAQRQSGCGNTSDGLAWKKPVAAGWVWGF